MVYLVVKWHDKTHRGAHGYFEDDLEDVGSVLKYKINIFYVGSIKIRSRLRIRLKIFLIAGRLHNFGEIYYKYLVIHFILGGEEFVGEL